MCQDVGWAVVAVWQQLVVSVAASLMGEGNTRVLRDEACGVLDVYTLCTSIATIAGFVGLFLLLLPVLPRVRGRRCLRLRP